MSHHSIVMEAREGRVSLKVAYGIYSFLPDEARRLGAIAIRLADAAETDAHDDRMEALAKKKAEAERLAREIAALELRTVKWP
jgi:hypothetical protein